MLNLGAIEVDKTIYVPFATYGDDGESITFSTFAVGDIKIYKDGSVTQRSSTNGFTLLDTDGTDFDGITGIGGFSVDLSDNSDSGFYAEGSEYWIVVDDITVNTQTVSFVAAVFNIQNRNSLLDELLQGNAHKTKFSVGAFIKKAGTGGGGSTSEATVHSGTAQAGATNTITLDTGALAVDNIYRGALINITGGTGVGQTNTIFSYVGSTRVATMQKDWITIPDATSTFDIIAASSAINSDEGVAQAGSASTITLAATASADDGIYDNALVSIISGTGLGQTRIISDTPTYNGTTKVATVTTNWGVNPDTTSVYVVIPDSEVSGDTTINNTQITNIVNEGSTMSQTKTWAAAVELVKTPAFGGSDSVLAADQEYDYSGDVDLETAGQNGAQVLVQVKLNFGTTRTSGAPAIPGSIVIDVFASLDGSTYDSIPMQSVTIAGRADGDFQTLTLTVKDVAHFRIGVKTIGTTDTFDYLITHQRYI
jgi:hypothetical protein